MFAETESFSLQRPLSILVYLHSFEPGGVERVALRLCEAWQAQGADVTLLIGRFDGALRSQAPELKLVSYSTGRLSTAPFETLWMVLCLWRRVRTAPPDVIFCSGNTYTIVAAALRLLLGARCPPILAKLSNSLTFCDSNPFVRAGYSLWLRAQARLVDRFVAMAPALRPEALTRMKLAAERVAVIHDPVLSEEDAVRLAVLRGRAPRSGGEERLFVSAGRLARQKRFDRLLRAFAAGARDGDRLVILGEGPQRKRLELLAAALGIADQVTMPGYCADLAPWLAQADAFVLASDYEGLPAVIVEALAAGVPVIATYSSAAIPDLIGNGRFGRLIGRRDLAALTRAIAEAGAAPFDPEAARAHAANFQLERGSTAYLELARALVRGPAGSTDAGLAVRDLGGLSVSQA